MNFFPRAAASDGIETFALGPPTASNEERDRIAAVAVGHVLAALRGPSSLTDGPTIYAHRRRAAGDPWWDWPSLLAAVVKTLHSQAAIEDVALAIMIFSPQPIRGAKVHVPEGVDPELTGLALKLLINNGWIEGEAPVLRFTVAGDAEREMMRSSQWSEYDRTVSDGATGINHRFPVAVRVRELVLLSGAVLGLGRELFSELLEERTIAVQVIARDDPEGALGRWTEGDRARNIALNPEGKWHRDGTIKAGRAIFRARFRAVEPSAALVTNPAGKSDEGDKTLKDLVRRRFESRPGGGFKKIARELAQIEAFAPWSEEVIRVTLHQMYPPEKSRR